MTEPPTLPPFLFQIGGSQIACGGEPSVTLGEATAWVRAVALWECVARRQGTPSVGVRLPARRQEGEV